MKITPKTQVTMNLKAAGQSHSRTKVATRDVYSVIDEPIERGGTNLGITPTETLMASLIGCTNVITKRIAHRKGVKTGNMNVDLKVDFDRSGVNLEMELEQPFSNIVMDIELETDADEATMEEIKEDLEKFCPIAKVIRNSGTTITENWTINPLEK